jgi:hypothetical protein
MLTANRLLILLMALCGAATPQTSGTQGKTPKKPGVKEVQIPFESLKPSATFKIGETADWVLVTDDAVWIAATKPYSVQRINPATTRSMPRSG